jgi:CO/xanthine dehydrogenase Mo-binding subunit
VSETWIGRALRRREDPPLLQGQGRYAGDNHPPGTVHIAVRRAGVPRGGGLTVDVSAALAMPGVIGAWSAGQIGLADDYMPNPSSQPLPIRRPVLARGEIRFEGDAVAVVAAEYEAITTALVVTSSVVPSTSWGMGGKVKPRDSAAARAFSALNVKLALLPGRMA